MLGEVSMRSISFEIMMNFYSTIERHFVLTGRIGKHNFYMYENFNALIQKHMLQPNYIIGDQSKWNWIFPTLHLTENEISLLSYQTF